MIDLVLYLTEHLGKIDQSLQTGILGVLWFEMVSNIDAWIYSNVPSFLNIWVRTEKQK